MTRLLTTLLLILLLTQPASAETLTLKSGKVLDGQIIEQTDQYLRIKTLDGVVRVELKLLRKESRAVLKAWSSRSVRASSPTEADPEDVSSVEKSTPNFKNPLSAVRYFKREVRKNPSAENYNKLAFAYANLSRFAQALESYAKAYEISGQYHPDAAKIYYNRGTRETLEQDFDAALTDFNRAIAIDPGLIGAYLNRGNVFFSVDKLDEALSDYNQVLTMQPDHPQAHLNRGNVYLAMGKFDSAIADFNQTLAKDEKQASAYYGRSVAYFQKHDLEKCWNNLQQAQAHGFKVPETFLKKFKEAVVKQK